MQTKISCHFCQYHINGILIRRKVVSDLCTVMRTWMQKKGYWLDGNFFLKK